MHTTRRRRAGLAPARRNGRGEARRAEILDHAVRLIAERGYAAVRPADIMSAVGASTALFYWYFRDMDDLVRELVVEARRTVLRSMAEAIADVHDPLEQLYLAARACLRMAFGSTTLRVLTAADAEGTIGGSFAREIGKTAEATVADTVLLLSEGQARGMITRDSTPLHLAYCLRATVQDTIVAYHRGHVIGDPAELADATAAFVLRAVCADPGQARRIQAAYAGGSEVAVS